MYVFTLGANSTQALYTLVGIINLGRPKNKLFLQVRGQMFGLAQGQQAAPEAVPGWWYSDTGEARQGALLF